MVVDVVVSVVVTVLVMVVVSLQLMVGGGACCARGSPVPSPGNAIGLTRHELARFHWPYTWTT